MHELGIARNILDIAQQSVSKEQFPFVRGIKIRVGPFAGVVPDSLSFCFSAIVRDTAMSQAELLIEQAPLTAVCRECRRKSEIGNFIFRCPDCGGGNLELISGSELEVAEIEIAEQEGENP